MSASRVSLVPAQARLAAKPKGKKRRSTGQSALAGDGRASPEPQAQKKRCKGRPSLLKQQRSKHAHAALKQRSTAHRDVGDVYFQCKTCGEDASLLDTVRRRHAWLTARCGRDQLCVWLPLMWNHARTTLAGAHRALSCGNCDLLPPATAESEADAVNRAFPTGVQIEWLGLQQLMRTMPSQ